MAELVLGPSFGLVVLTIIFSAGVHHLWMALSVGNARKKYKVFYPLMYAPADHEHAKQFNCIQRGHQNSLEGWPLHVTLTLLVGIKFPFVAFLTGAAYTIGRILYFKGYSTGDPKKRFQGVFYHFTYLAQMAVGIYIGILFLLGK